MGDMLFEIQGKLREMENKENIKILLVAESEAEPGGPLTAITMCGLSIFAEPKII